MVIFPLHRELARYLVTRGLVRKFEKQARLFTANIRHPSLEVELLEPNHLKLWSFRIDKKYRAIFIWRSKDVVEIIDINNHYK